MAPGPQSIRTVKPGSWKDKYRFTATGAERFCSRCEKWLPATLEHFQKSDTAMGVKGFCWPCHRQYRADLEYRKRRERGEIKGKEWGWKWSGEWVELAPEDAKRIRISAYATARRLGHSWLEDDVAAEALVRAAQGNWVNMETCFWSVFDHHFGHSGTDKREASNATISLDDIDEFGRVKHDTIGE